MASQRSCGAFLPKGASRARSRKPLSAKKHQRAVGPGCHSILCKGPSGEESGMSRPARQSRPACFIPPATTQTKALSHLCRVNKNRLPGPKPSATRTTWAIGLCRGGTKKKSGYKLPCFLTDAHSMFLSRKEFVYLVPEY